MKITTLSCGSFATNCYVLEMGEEMVLIDPTGKANRFLGLVQGHKLVAILLTHGHFDHIGAVDEIVKQAGCPVYLHQEDWDLARSTEVTSPTGMNAHIASPIQPLNEGQMQIGNFRLEVIEAPGHTPGSVLLRFNQDCFCGDVVFEGSIGRTDLLYGNESRMRQTIKMIKQLDPELKFYPGHGCTTTLAKELQTNPFFR